jgi:hypothetical protein
LNFILITEDRRCKKLLDDLKRRERILSSERGGFQSHYVEGTVLEEALNRTMWKESFWRRL